jgi:nitrite reductase/ring-hydroxylating ferredoxin subunit
MNKKNFTLAIFTGIMFFFTDCKKEDKVVPDVPIDIYIYTTDPSFVNLNAVGGWVYITGGSRGIVIYRRTNTEFSTIERHCTYQPENSCARVEVDSSNIILVDHCCGSKFLITDGALQNGPATRPLKLYNNTFDGTVLHIYN